MTERELQDAIVECAVGLGWLVHHDRPSMTRRGRWLTAVQGHPGFPDLVLVRPPRVLFVELKSGAGEISQWQQEWLSALADCLGVETYVWRPCDWHMGEVERVLRKEMP